MVRKTTFTPGSAARIWRAASIPLREGMETSMTTTSGFEGVRGRDRLSSVRRDPHHVEMGREQAPQPLRDHTVVVGHQYPRLASYPAPL